MPLGQVGDAHRGVGGVDALPAGPGRAEDVDAQVVRVDLHLDVLGLREHEHAGRGRVDAALRLGHRHALHAVDAALVLQPGPDALARRRRAPRLHRERHVLVAAEVGLGRLDDLGLPAHPLGVAQVHPQQVAGEQRRLLAALPRLDLDDDVLVVVGVARQQQQAQPVLELAAPRLEHRDLGAERLVLVGQLAGRRQVARELGQRPLGLDDRGQLGIALARRCAPGSGRRASPGRRAPARAGRARRAAQRMPRSRGPSPTQEQEQPGTTTAPVGTREGCRPTP